MGPLKRERGRSDEADSKRRMKSMRRRKIEERKEKIMDEKWTRYRGS